jgi:phosphatidylglycerophosphate synthase
MNETSDGRRPIASRESGWAKASARGLAKRNVSPNFISLLSIFFSIVAFAAFYLDAHAEASHTVLMILAIVGIEGRLIMNLFDGMVAVEHNKKSAVGGLYNEVPDRVSDTFIIVGAGLLAKDHPYGMDLAYLATILAVVTAYIRTLGASLNCGHHFLGPMAKQHRMALLVVACIAGIWYVPVFYYSIIVMNVGLVVTCYRRLSKIASLLRQKSTDTNP